MKYLGIDYGLKRVGVSVSDDNASLAFPKAVFANDSNLLDSIAELCSKEGVRAIVLGESRNFAGEPNPIQEKIAIFHRALSERAMIPVFSEPEFLTSAAAEHIQGKTASHDASAAALILQSFLDKTNNRG